MTPERFYRLAILGPALGLVIAAVLARPSGELPPGWEWVYPTSITRGLLVYCLLAAWLWIAIGRQPLERFARRVWLVPLLYVALGWVLMLGLALLRGQAGELWSEHAGAILLRTGVHLAVGYGYVALVSVAAHLLRQGGELRDAS